MKSHPAADIFPLMSPDELSRLAADIKANGLHEPIITIDDAILDGRNRLAACDVAGVKPRFTAYTGKDPLGYVVSKNLHRRHLTREQRDAVIVKLREQGMTLKAIAESVGVSPQTAMRATESATIPNGKVAGADGKERPAHYTPREAGPESDDDLDKEKPVHYEIYDDFGGQEGVTVPPGHELQIVKIGKPHVANNASDNEWYTPKAYIAAARSVMGDIALDPASHADANKIVKAAHIFTAEDDGLKHEWAGKVWMNPPYDSALVGKFAEKLASSVESGKVPEAMVLVNNATETKWFVRLAGVTASICFPTGRVKFWHPRKESAPLQGQAVLYIGKHGRRFCAEFKRFGIVAEIIR